MLIKSLLKALVPDILISSLKNKKKDSHEEWTLNAFSSYDDAIQHNAGYKEKGILEKCEMAALKVKNGDAVYERDSVPFDEVEYSWGLLAGLEKAALENNSKLCVLDFGGGLGSSYNQNRSFLTNTDLEWCIIEQHDFVASGKRHFENDCLKFYFTVEECLQKHSPNVLLLSGVLQYLDDPDKWISKFSMLKIPYIILDRTAFSESGKEMIALQNIHETIYKASLPHWFFNEKKLINSWKGYKLLAGFNSFADGNRVLPDGEKAFWKGFILEYRNEM